MGYYDKLDDTNYTDTISKFREFSANQKLKILGANQKRNFGTVKSDVADDEYSELSGVTPADDSPEIDHVLPKSKGGTNEYKNAQVTSRKYNNSKRAKAI